MGARPLGQRDLLSTAEAQRGEDGDPLRACGMEPVVGLDWPW
jgi:hypothetical protein